MTGSGKMSHLQRCPLEGSRHVFRGVNLIFGTADLVAVIHITALDLLGAEGKVSVGLCLETALAQGSAFLQEPL